MHKVKNWNIKRSGPCMTVNGNDPATGKPIKVTGVHSVIPSLFMGVGYINAYAIDGLLLAKLIV